VRNVILSGQPIAAAGQSKLLFFSFDMGGMFVLRRHRSAQWEDFCGVQ